jgi:hypothetical protein
MSLDSYLKKHTYIGAEYKHNEVKGVIQIIKQGKLIPILLERVDSITETICHWKNAYHIHNWFLSNTYSSDERNIIEIYEIKELFETCEKIEKDFKLADELLPTRNGIYDTSYKESIKYTIKTIKSLLKEKEDFEILYSFTY